MAWEAGGRGPSPIWSSLASKALPLSGPQFVHLHKWDENACPAGFWVMVSGATVGLGLWRQTESVSEAIPQPPRVTVPTSQEGVIAYVECLAQG